METDSKAGIGSGCAPQSLTVVTGEECRRLADRLNRDCQCVSLDRDTLRRELVRDPAGADLYRMIVEGRPTLFSESTVFLGAGCIARMKSVIEAIERVVAIPAFQERAFAHAPSIARHDPRTHGVFLGYDFHQGADGPQLIEINTNAGGGLLNAVLARAQQACCEPVATMLPGLLEASGVDEVFFEMFMQEWQAARGDAPLRCVAIVDDHPEAQFLFPEFVLFRKLFEHFGLETHIVDPRRLRYGDGGLWLGESRIDLVYNRLTDFALQEADHGALRAAYLADAVVVTPHPRAHALYADKRNLTLLTDEGLLAEWGVDADNRHLLLSGIPRTEIVRPDLADSLWQRRKQLFFKPAAGYGSKAAYRGDKVTRRVFEEILAGDYVAQALVPPGERLLDVADEQVALKVDLRCYVYRSRIQLLSARLYRGQTTNFRTAGGGFAPVLTVPCPD